MTEKKRVSQSREIGLQTRALVCNLLHLSRVSESSQLMSSHQLLEALVVLEAVALCPSFWNEGCSEGKGREGVFS